MRKGREREREIGGRGGERRRVGGGGRDRVGVGGSGQSTSSAFQLTIMGELFAYVAVFFFF